MRGNEHIKELLLAPRRLMKGCGFAEDGVRFRPDLERTWDAEGEEHPWTTLQGQG